MDNNVKELITIPISHATIIGFGVIIVVTILIKDFVKEVSHKLVKKIFGEDKEEKQNNEERRSNVSAVTPCVSHPSIVEELKYVKRHISWTGRILLLVAQKLDLRNLPDEPEE